jgi:hypothetical protein
MLAAPPDPIIVVPLYLVVLMIVAVTLFAVFKLAQELSSTVVGVLCAVLMLVPCNSLLTLVVINSKATTFLQQRGIKVGFMGVNPNNI